ncbi:hypothetical protein [Lignipirellula cremea]|uniref:Uncharacterized protein n=1 Tax=Lignipirellula cremea TaxID=2528010 RepID=A0A518DVW9_9BACT|nr:hypothetical protein [Lignipirellula cremea]QDU95977.1 hypothetical protein Pla8534_37960 [Lignipirellula cremea]
MLDRRHLLASLVAGSFSLLSQDVWAGKTGGRGMRVPEKPQPSRRPPLKYLHYREPRLLFFSTNEEPSQAQLARLQQPGGEFALLADRGWEIGQQSNDHLQLISVEQRPDLVARYQANDFPWVGCLTHGEIVRVYQASDKAELDRWTLVWLLTGTDRRPAPDVEIPPRELVYPSHNGHWIVIGDHAPIQEVVISHLHGGMHGHQIPADWKLEDWTYPELRSLHDDLHRFGRPRDLVQVG